MRMSLWAACAYAFEREREVRKVQMPQARDKCQACGRKTQCYSYELDAKAKTKEVQA